MQIRLATRGSRLALAQSGLIADALGALGAEVELVQVRTLGDVSTAPLSSLGGVGVFVAAVREAVLSGACDLAVHSLKDLPTTPADGLVLAAVPPREDPRDALCARDGLTLASLPTGATVGTGSPRRAAQLAITRPDLRIVDIRGNVDTRLGRVGADLDAVVLAVAGLNRLGLSAAITQVIDPSDMLPAPAQGALAIECRSDDDPLRALLAELDDPASRLAVETERTIMRLVEAGCSAPFGALAQVADEGLAVNARLVTGAGARSAMAVGPLVAAPALAARVAHEVAPLRGLRVLMPSSGLADVLSAEGAVVTTAAFTHTEPLDIGGFVEALGRRPDVLAFTSARTLRVIEGAGLDLAQLIGPEVVIAAVGHATAAAIEAAGLTVTVRPAAGSGGAVLAAAFPDGPGTVLVPGAADPAPELSAHLRARRWQVTTVPVYRTIDASAIDASIAEAWPDQDVFVVTAPSIARAATKLLGVPGPPVVAIGSTSAAAARELGLEVAATAAEATPVGLVEALISLRKDST